MASIEQPRFLRTLAIALLVTLPAVGTAAVTVSIDGAAYPAELRENTELLRRAHVARSTRVRHYEGALRGIPNSWIRASDIRGRWQGVVALEDSRFVIDTPPQHDRAGNLLLEAHSPTEIMAASSCAAEAPAMTTASFAAELNTGVAAANFATVCQTTVDGVCLLAELDIAFDLLFQQRYPTTYQDQAAAILNIVEGYYRNDLTMDFDTLSMTFLTNDLFSTTTDSGALLTDITTKKNAGQVPFVTNRRAILHVVTGRDFDTTTVGIANVGTLCSQSDNAGTSQIVQNSIGFTALVVAHEIGHNFGALHDATQNACTNGFIMAAQLNSNASHLSSCSITEMTTTINGLSNLAACFEYPVDAALTARPGNPNSAGANENFTLSFDVSETHASVASATLNVSGNFTGAGATFIGATINGIVCTLGAAAQTYSCATNDAGGLLEVTARVTGGSTVTVNTTVTASTAGSVKDINTSNNSVSQVVVAATPPAAPSGLTATANAAQINLAWQDNSNNESGFRVERRSATGSWAQIATTASNVTVHVDNVGLSSGVTYEYRIAAFGAGGTSAASPSVSAQLTVATAKTGGGGGGSSGIELALLLLTLLALRRRHPRVS